MRTVFRWLLRIAAGLVVLVVASIALAYYFAAQSLPDYDNTVEVAGLSAPVEIVRDQADVPHVFGASDTDVFFGLGYAHAQDRLWQMTILRRTVQGRLSEVFGPSTLHVDRLLRRLDLYRLAQESVAAQTPQARAALDAYAAGVNARLAEINDQALGRGAPEMFLFNAPVSPWQAGDSLALIKLMALQLSSHLESEVLRARVSLLIPDARLRDRKRRSSTVNLCRRNSRSDAALSSARDRSAHMASIFRAWAPVAMFGRPSRLAWRRFDRTLSSAIALMVATAAAVASG